MSQEAAVAFLERVETDEKFANELESLTEDPAAVVEKIRAEGFDVQPDEVRQAFLDRYGAELTPEQMEQIAAGADSGDAVGYALAGAFVVGVAAAAAGI